MNGDEIRNSVPKTCGPAFPRYKASIFKSLQTRPNGFFREFCVVSKPLLIWPADPFIIANRTQGHKHRFR